MDKPVHITPALDSDALLPAPNWIGDDEELVRARAEAPAKRGPAEGTVFTLSLSTRCCTAEFPQRRLAIRRWQTRGFVHRDGKTLWFLDASRSTLHARVEEVYLFRSESEVRKVARQVVWREKKRIAEANASLAASARDAIGDWDGHDEDYALAALHR